MCYDGTFTRAVNIVKAEEQCQGGATTILEAHMDPEKAADLVAKLNAAGDGSMAYSIEVMKLV